MLSDSRIETSNCSQTKRKQVADPAWLTKKSSGTGYVFAIAKSPLGIFQETKSNLRHQKSGKKVKKCKKVKVKAFVFSVGGQTGEDCLPYLTDGLKSRIRH